MIGPYYRSGFITVVQRVSQSITAIQVFARAMKPCPAAMSLAVLIVLVCLVPCAGRAADVQAVENSDQARDRVHSPASFEVGPAWDDVYAGVNVTFLETAVRYLSEQCPQRVWYPLDKAPSPQLEKAWDYVNDTLIAQTGGLLHFDLVTEQLDLVAVKTGSRPHSAPLIVSGAVASQWVPGANAYGASAAAVLETARVLSSMNLTNDVYFVLINTGSGSFGGSSGSIGIDALLNELADDGVRPAALLYYHRLLYRTEEPNGHRVILDYSDLSSAYSQENLLADIACMASNMSGAGDALAVDSASDIWLRSGAYEAYVRGIPGFVVTQYYPDSYSGTINDTWDVASYSYPQLAEAVGTVSAVVSFFGSLNRGEAPVLEHTVALAGHSTGGLTMPLSGLSLVNVSISWTGSTTLKADIQSPSSIEVYTRTESDNLIHLAYLVQLPGQHTLSLTNLGDNAVDLSVSYTHWHDYDWDGLDDRQEFLYKTDSLSSDSDSDQLDDQTETLMGSDPNIADSDSDGAIDGVEIAHESNPLVQDTDNDTVLDGLEIELGMNPTVKDSDDDGVDDGVELSLGTNPLSNDSDVDGLTDSTELMLGTSPLLPDSDSDGLGDYFEALNGLNPLSQDSDSDGQTDVYEIEHCLDPINPDTDSDGIIDGIDWAPREHWILTAPPVALIVLLLGVVIWLAAKRRAYVRRGNSSVA